MRLLTIFLVGLMLPGALETASAVSSADFDRIVDFSVTIKDVAGLERTDKMLILDGTVAQISILDQDEQSYTAQVELISGEWIDLEEVKSYRCTVLFRGARYARVFPARAPREPSADVVTANSRVLVVARPTELVRAPGGGTQWLLEGIHVRTLQ